MGQMIGIPFVVWLFWTSFEFGNNDQIFAVIGLIGLISVFTKYYNNRVLRVLIFGSMLTPIVRRLTEIPIEKFNYLAFQIPLLIFITTFLILIFKPNPK
tara:strand:+ start:84047 stop:84343 length:297 start_codon:yes stop_codon:yes gene_type:complete